ncbi:NYN domain-containing protein, partial [Rubrivivax gelatinosus]
MSTERVMLLIDADNVSVDVMEQAVELLLDAHGALHVRRAYCTAESALKHQATFKRLGIKPMVNLAAGKNSTDIAMAVDAIDLVIAERPDVVAIASSDSDFAPLVQRLREKGCRVVGIGQEGKTGDETISVYDAFTVFAHRRGRVAAPAPARAAQRGQRAGTRGGAGQRNAP